MDYRALPRLVSKWRSVSSTVATTIDAAGRGRAGLLVYGGLAVGLPVLALLIGELAGLPLDPALHPQLLAPPPLDVFHDLRYAVLLSTSYTGFALALAAVLALRLALFWVVWGPVAGITTGRAAQGVMLYSVAMVVMAVPAVLSYVFAASRYALVFEWYNVVVLLALVILGPVPSVYARCRELGISAWRGYVRLLSRPMVFLGLPVLLFLALTASGGLAAFADNRVSGAARLAAMAALVGLGGGLAWVTAALYINRIRRSAGRAASFRGYAVLVAIVAVGVTLALYVSRSQQPQAVEPRTVPPNDNIQLVLPGVDSATGVGAMAQFDMTFLGYPREDTVFYSYRGPGRGVEPLPYGYHDTHQSIQASALELQRTLMAIKEAFPGRQVDIVDLSLAGWIVRYYMLEMYDPSRAPVIEHVTSFSMPAIGSTAPIPGEGERECGFIGGQALRTLFFLGRWVDYSYLEFDAPIWQQTAFGTPFVESLTFHPPPPPVKEMVVWAVRDLEGLAGPRMLPGVETLIVPTYHSDVPWHPETLDALWRFLADRPIRGAGVGTWVHDVLWYGAAPWKLPMSSHIAEKRIADALDPGAERYVYTHECALLFSYRQR